jgi:hypothetical protein
VASGQDNTFDPPHEDVITPPSIPVAARLLRRFLAVTILWSAAVAHGTPANKAGFEAYYDRFLPRTLAQCTTCHLPSEHKAPESLDEFPHNSFGDRLRRVAKELAPSGPRPDIAARLKAIAIEDADGDGVDNQTELLLGRVPGDAASLPEKSQLETAQERRDAFAEFLLSYRWRPFKPVLRPVVPSVTNPAWVRNPVDAFIASEHDLRGLKPRPGAPKPVLLRRVYLDLIGLSPTPAEQRAFLEDHSPDAYERVVDRLLNDPRHGERWARHWMDVWRYSDWAGWSGGNQIRDSKPHIWRWRDWIVESLNADKPYDRMVVEMLAADELAPEDPEALRATGFLVRNYKMLSREQWLEDTVKHTSQAFLGLTVGCAKCHDHMFDPVSQAEYYQLRAVFEPHQVRTDHVPGEPDTAKNGLVRAFDAAAESPTYFFIRGDERRPDTNRVMLPDVPHWLGGKLEPAPVDLPPTAAFPEQREFVIRDAVRASEAAVAAEQKRFEDLKSGTNTTRVLEQEFKLAVAAAKHESLLAVLRTEKLEPESDSWKTAAMEAARAQRELALAQARLKIHTARHAQGEARTKADEAARAVELAGNPPTEGAETAKASADKLAARKKDSEKAAKALEAAEKSVAEAEKELAEAEKQSQAELTTVFKPREQQKFPVTSSGRRLAFAQWVVRPENPLTARVAVNHVWLRHFGQAIVGTPADFGRNGRPPTHPQLLDWLASEFMAQKWSMRALHRLIVTSSTYRMASTPDTENSAVDPDNVWLWRMPSRRLEAEVIRDNLLNAAGDLDAAMGGPEIDHQHGLKSRRRSVYLRIAAEKEVEFLKIFDGPSVTECYSRRPTVVPQQALALANSELTRRQARSLAQKIVASGAAEPAAFAKEAFARILGREPAGAELEHCRSFLSPEAGSSASDRTRENLLLVLFNHNDFVTAR